MLLKEIHKKIKIHLVKKLIGYKVKNTHYESVSKYYKCIIQNITQSFHKARNIALKAHKYKRSN